MLYIGTANMMFLKNLAVAICVAIGYVMARDFSKSQVDHVIFNNNHKK